VLRSVTVAPSALSQLRALVAQAAAELSIAGGGSLAGAGAPVVLAMGVPTAHPLTASRGRGPGQPGDADNDDNTDNVDQQRMAALLTLAQQGDGEAFGQIYDAYVGQVYRYLYYRVGSQPLAEDLTSETFLRALRRIDSFTWQGRDICAWFITIARNLVTDHYKSSRFRLEVSTADMLDADRADDGIEQEVLGNLENQALLAAVRQLKSEQQECVVLRFLQGLSVAETAAVMGRSDGAIKQLQLRAVRALAKLLPEPVQ
jgi:RNA polymerase sigma-70 factor (ECF subfamily)